MKYMDKNRLAIVESDTWPLDFLDWRIDEVAMLVLIKAIAHQRQRRFQRIIFSGGLAVQTPWTRTVKLKRSWYSSQSRLSLTYGYFDPLKQEIILFPETILAALCLSQGISQARLRRLLVSPANHEKFRNQLEREFYPMVIEEIEHGYQDNRSSGYRSLWSRLVMWTSPLLMPAVAMAVGYGVFTQQQWRWYLGVFSLLMGWIFLPVWITLLPKPNWYRSLGYRFNRREHEAKGKAISIRYYRMARTAIELRFKH